MPGILNWDLGDSSNNVNSNAFSHTYSSVGTKNIVVKQGTIVPAAEYVSEIDMSSDDLVGTIDISGFTRLTSFNVNNNKKLTKVINPVTSETITLWRADDCSLNGTLDMSGLTGLGGQFYVYNNPNLTQILNPTSSAQINEYYAWYCDLTGTLDVSGLTGLLDFEVSNNPNLTQIINSNSSQVFAGYIANNCNLTGTLDVSGLTGLGGLFYVFNNPNLTKILNPVSSEQLFAYSAYNCGLTGTLDVSGLTGLGVNFSIYDNTALQNLILPNVISSSDTGVIIFRIDNCSLNTASIDAAFQKLANFWDANIPTSHLSLFAHQGNNGWLTDGSDNRNLCKIQNIIDGSTIYDASIYFNPEPYPNTSDGSVNVIYFNNSSYVHFTEHPDVSGYNGPLSFRCYLDVSNYTGNECLIYNCASPSTGELTRNETFIVFMDSSSMCFQFGTVDTSADGRINIAAFVKQKLFIEVERIQAAGFAKLGYVKINGAIQPLTYNNSTTIGNFNAFNIGVINNTDTSSFWNKANKMSIWDIRFPRRGHWKGGYVDASLNSSWIDTIGNINGSLVGDVSTRKL